MHKEKTELVFIIDKSGSMSGLENDTIGGYNRLITEQKKLEGKCTLTTIFFNTRLELVHDRIPLHEIAPLSREDYRPGGATALLDAIGYGIKKTETMLRGTLHHERPRNIIVAIITDGEENSSREYRHEQIKRLITLKEKDGWTFQFLGANIDTFATADMLGIRRQHAHSYVASEKGIGLMYSKLSEEMLNLRKKGQ